jgi:hypothetical protein
LDEILTGRFAADAAAVTLNPLRIESLEASGICEHPHVIIF